MLAKQYSTVSEAQVWETWHSEKLPHSKLRQTKDLGHYVAEPIFQSLFIEFWFALCY